MKRESVGSSISIASSCPLLLHGFCTCGAISFHARSKNRPLLGIRLIQELFRQFPFCFRMGKLTRPVGKQLQVMRHFVGHRFCPEAEGFNFRAINVEHPGDAQIIIPNLISQMHESLAVHFTDFFSLVPVQKVSNENIKQMF
jgi:hypothetical protein